MSDLELVGRRLGQVGYTTPSRVLSDTVRELDVFVLKKIPSALERAVKVYLREVQKDLLSKHSNPYSKDAVKKTVLSKRSGEAMRSIVKSVKVEASVKQVIGKIGGIHYLKSHEYGAVIRPKRSNYLTIPLPAALDSRGVPKKRSAREWKDTFVIKSKKGNLLIVRKKRAGIEPLYVLKKRVVIPKRLGMRDAIGRNYTFFAYYLAKEVKREFSL